MDCTAFGLLLLAARFLVAGTLIAAGVSKLNSPAASARVIAALCRTESGVSLRSARWLGIVEVAGGAMLSIGLGVTVVAGFAALFFLAASVGLSWLLRKGFDGSCGCFGDRGSLDSLSVGRPVGLAICSGALIAVENECALSLATVTPVGHLAAALVLAAAVASTWSLAGAVVRLMTLAREE
jgi:hypothetical protein